MKFNPGINIQPNYRPMGFTYGEGVFGPPVENRTLDSIRHTLLEPDCTGPEIVYSIAMDVGKNIHRELLMGMNLLFGVVMYAGGRIGTEPVRSQGHIHKVSPKSGMSTPEVYEIWQGKGIIYMQEYGDDDPGRCFAVTAAAGDVVIVPPGWTHATVSADPSEPLVFGAWCDRDYGFEYGKVHSHGGIAWFPLYGSDGKIEWKANERYKSSYLEIKRPGDYSHLGIVSGEPIYTTFERRPEAFLYVTRPDMTPGLWDGFVP